MSRSWLIRDCSDPPIDGDDTEPIIARVTNIDEAIVVFDRLRLMDGRFLLLTDESSKGWFMIGLGKASAHVRYVPPETLHCAFRLMPITPLVAEGLHYPAEQDWVDVPPERLFTIGQFYDLLRYFERDGVLPDNVKTQYDWE